MARPLHETAKQALQEGEKKSWPCKVYDLETDQCVAKGVPKEQTNGIFDVGGVPINPNQTGTIAVENDNAQVDVIFVGPPWRSPHWANG